MKKTSLHIEVMTFGDKQLNSFPFSLGMDWIWANIEKIDIRQCRIEFLELVKLIEVHSYEEYDKAIDSQSLYIGQICFGSQLNKEYSVASDHKTSQADRMDWIPAGIDDMSIRNQWTDANRNAVALRLPIQYRP